MILTKRHFETINNYDFTWTDIQKPTRDNISTLGSHELNLDDFLSKIHIPKIDKYKDHLFIILNFPVNMREEKHEYDIFVGINYF
jgi:magnesium transporter